MGQQVNKNGKLKKEGDVKTKKSFLFDPKPSDLFMSKLKICKQYGRTELTPVAKGGDDL
jgi:hypothetical protein